MVQTKQDHLICTTHEVECTLGAYSIECLLVDSFMRIAGCMAGCVLVMMCGLFHSISHGTIAYIRKTRIFSLKLSHD